MKPICLDGARPTDTLRRKRLRPVANGASFAEALLGESTGCTAASSAHPASTLSSVLPVEMLAEDGERNRRRAARQHGAGLLDRLEEVRSGLLHGRIPATSLAQLASALASRREASDDAELEQLIAEIELRAQVELAKIDCSR